MSIRKKKDRFSKAKGGKSTLYDIFCAHCGCELFTYQKDGTGGLVRCYINRILAPESMRNLQYDENIKRPQDVPNLQCPDCNEVIGLPIKRHDGRIAFRLKKSFFHKKISKKG